MNQELYNNLICACAVFNIREKYDSQIRSNLDILTNTHKKKMKLFYDLNYAKKWELAQKTEKYNKTINEEIEPISQRAKAEIDRLCKEEKQLWEQNQHYLEFLPHDYRTPIAVSFMMSTIKNGRAETLKEALNLYENAVAQWRLEQKLSNMAQMRELQYSYMTSAMKDIEDRQKNIQDDLRYIMLDQKNSNNY